MHPVWIDERFMCNTKRSSLRAAILVASSSALTLLGACSPQKSAEISQSENMLILEELSLQSGPAQYTLPQTQGPVLVAGDWLAIQCASVGNYFEGFDWAPVYATVETSGFE